MAPKTNKPAAEAAAPETQAISTSGSPESDPKITVEAIDLEGKIIKLRDGISIWRSNSGRIDLNVFSGIMTAKLPKDLDESEKKDLFRGLNIGRIELTDKEFSSEPISMGMKDLSSLHQVNLFLDEKKLNVFEQNVKKTPSQSFLSLCLSTEESDRNREEYKTILKEKLNTLTR